MTRWKLKATAFEDRAKDYTASFVCTNTETGASVDISIRQDKGKPASDLIGSCRALAQLFISVNDEPDDTNTARLN